MRERRQAFLLTSCAMIAFAGNSILCRLALRGSDIDAASFTAVRLLSGAAVLLQLLLRAPARKLRGASSWASAFALFAYACAFSFAYVRLTAAVGALVLFGAVQLSMVGIGLSRGQRLHARQGLGFGLSIAGLLGLTLPNASAPDPVGAVLMALAGVAWGVYSMRGAGSSDPLTATAGNFLRTLPFVALLALASAGGLHANGRGLWLAIASGAIASGAGYIVWYAALRHLLAVEAALVQLSVPVLAAAAGIAFLGEALTPRLAAAAAAILSGIAIAVTRRG